MALLAPAAVSAQSDLDAAEAQAFMGDWVVALDSDMGPFTLDLEIADAEGKVTAAIGSPDMGGPMQDVTEIMRSGEGLTLAWELDAQGQIVDAMLILSPDGENLSTLFTVADGQFSASGVATRAES
jgi:hypothetical protein